MEKDTKKKKTADNFKKDIKDKPTTKKKPMNMITSTIHSELFIRVVGTFFVLLSVFLFFSFVSFFISWKLDYNIVESSSAWDLLSGSKNIKNWGGTIGAFLSYIMIVSSFGIASFGYILIFTIIGLRFFGIKFNTFGRIIIYTFIIMLWLSAVIGFVVYFFKLENFYELAGVVGISINTWLHSFSGNVGAILILIFFTITLPMIMFGVKYTFIKDIFQKISKQADNKKESNIEIPKEVESKENESDDINPIQEDIKLSPTNISKEQSNDIDGLTELEKEKLLQFEIKENQTQNSLQPNFNQNSEEAYKFDKNNIEQNQPKKKSDKDVELEFEIDSTNQQNQNIAVVSNQNQILGEAETNEDETLHRNDITTTYDPKEDLSSFVFPSTDFLVNYEERNQEVKQEELVANKDRIVNTLKNYNIDISKIVATPGPTVTLYEIVPAPGIRISKIKNLEDDIALSLSALGIRIIAPIPGRGTIGIEVPNQHPQIVSMKTMLNSIEFKESKFELPIAIGKTISNKPYITDLAKMPHLLMAGATGQGKSVGLNAIISSLLYKKHPAELKFVMVDPKKVELSLYTKIERHYLAKLPDSEEAIITDTRKVVRTINSLCIEMDQRYDLLKNAQVKNIKEYNPKFCSRKLNPENGHRFLPYIVLVIDEFADLIMTAGKEIEMPIARLAQLARAVGIHLIIATQRPSVNIITGIIKANFPVRVAFRVTSKIDSRTILDMGGADQLIGRGDMLLSSGNEIIRLQCALIDTEEIEQVAEFIGSQRGYPETFLLPEYIDENSEPNKEFDPKQIDDKFEEAARIIVTLQHGSTSIIQRKLSLGYNRAGRIIDQLEAAGIVGPFEGSKARDVKIKTEMELDELLKGYLGK